MTTENLEGIEEMIAARTARAAQWRQRAVDLLRERQELTTAAAADKAAAEMERRASEQYFTDMLAPVDHEIDQVVYIVSGPQDVIDTEPPAQPTEPVVAVVTPDPPAPPVAVDPPTAPIPTVIAPPDNTSAPVAYVRWVRSWRLLEWVLALLLAFIAFKISGDHQNFGFRTGSWSTVQHAFWRVGWTLIGFTIGGFIGSWLRPFGERYVTTYRTGRNAPVA